MATPARCCSRFSRTSLLVQWVLLAQSCHGCCLLRLNRAMRSGCVVVAVCTVVERVLHALYAQLCNAFWLYCRCGLCCREMNVGCAVVEPSPCKTSNFASTKCTLVIGHCCVAALFRRPLFYETTVLLRRNTTPCKPAISPLRNAHFSSYTAVSQPYDTIE